MLEQKIANFIGGKDRPAYSGEFTVNSQFFDYSVTLPNSSEVELTRAISEARHVMSQCGSLTLEQRSKILLDTAASMTFDDSEIEHLVKMTGMPISKVKERIEFGRRLLSSLPHSIEERVGHSSLLPMRKVNGSGFEIYLPPEGITCAFIPPNDPAEPFFILAHAVMAGASIIIKPSQGEPYISSKLAKCITQNGYPEGGINVVYWNTHDESRADVSAKLVKSCYNRVIMGDEKTASHLLNVVDDNNKPIRGNDCIYSAGKTKWIVDKDVDYEMIAKKIAKAALDWPMDCITPRTVVIVGDENADKLSEYLSEEFNRRRLGNPLQTQTDIGYLPENMIDETLNGLKTAQEFNAVHVIKAPVKIGKNMMSPGLVQVYDYDSSLLKSEIPYMISIVSVPDLNSAVDFLNKVCEGEQMMAVSLFSTTLPERLDYGLLSRIPAHMKFYNRSTMELDPALCHQDKYLFEILAKLSPLIMEGRS